MSGVATYNFRQNQSSRSGPSRTKPSMESTLSIVSLGFGLLATVVLGLSVAADYWLHTIEPYDIGPLVPGLSDMAHGQGSDGDTTDLGVAARGPSGGAAFAGGRLILLSTHSGLWRICVFTVSDHTSALPSDDNSGNYCLASLMHFLQLLQSWM